MTTTTFGDNRDKWWKRRRRERIIYTCEDTWRNSIIGGDECFKWWRERNCRIMAVCRILEINVFIRENGRIP
jgi:hypothetical protein